MKNIKKWKEFWSTSCRPFHTQDSAAFYEQYAREVSALIPGNFSKTLDIGCGTGGLYPYLASKFGDYIGVDYSESMLTIFKENNPDVELICADGSEYADDRLYDLIFCNGVIQNFNRPMLDRFFKNVFQMLSDDGICFIGMTPDRYLRFGFTSGYLRQHAARSTFWKSWLRYIRSVLIGKDGIGYWFDATEFSELAGDHGFDCYIYGSILYRYRFHAVLKKAK